MSVVVKTLIYVVFVAAMYANEYDVPVMLYYKRAVYLANWKIAAYMQRRTISAYHTYTDEAEYTRG